MTREITHRLLVLALSLIAFCAPASAQESVWRTWDQEALTAADVQGARDKVDAALGARTEPAANGSVEARMQAALKRRLELLDELGGTLTRREELAASIGDNPGKVAELRAEIDLLREAAEPLPPATATAAGFRELERSVEVLRAEMATIQGRVDAAAQRLDRAQELGSATARRLTEAQQKQTDLARQLDAAPAGAERELLQLQAANAELNARIATEQRALLDREAEGDGVLGEYRNLAQSLAEFRFERGQQELELYEAVLQTTLEEERTRSEADLAAKERVAETADDPFERFVARWQVDVARSEKNRADVEPFRIDVSTETTEQQERLDSDRKELERLRADADASGTGGAVGAAIQRVFKHLEQRRKAIEYAVKPRFENRVEELANRRFEIDQMLYELNDRWSAETEAAVDAGDASETDVKNRTRQARELRDTLRTALQAERAALTEAINGLRQLREVQRSRTDVLQELETFIQTKVFWIQDIPAVSGATFSSVPAELRATGDWARRVASRDLRATLDRAGARALALLLLGVIGIPVMAILLRRRIRRFLERQDVSSDFGVWRALGLSAAAAVQSVLLAGCFVAFALLVPVLDLDGDLAEMVSRLLWVLALSFLLRSVGRAFFGNAGLATRLSWLPEDASIATRRLLRLVSLGVLVCLLPWSVLSVEVLDLHALPRLCLTAFLLVLVVATYWSCSGRSALTCFVVGEEASRHAGKLRTAWSAFLAVALVAVVVLELSGRRFAARAIGESLGETLLTIFVLAVLYRLAQPLIERAITTEKADKKRKKKKTSTTGASREPRAAKVADRQARRAQVQRIVRVVFCLVGAWLIILYWGLNDQVLGALQGWKLYAAGADPVEGTKIWVAASDVFLSLVVLTATVWILRHLPGIYELAIFPRFDLDRGLRYAIVTMSRYGLFFLGAAMALRLLRVDFSGLGWLIAAMGVGLGFGLQEIVSNFVSGIILLVERPIRVGDLVTVGDVIGKIQRINIRATTVLNMDRQEVIVPNRALIAQNVTNWTLASKVLRLIARIGVAYGSDIDRVRQILHEVVAADPDVLDNPAPQVLFVAHGDSSLDFEVRIFVDDPDRRWPILDQVNSAINRALAENGVEIPFPQRDIHVRSGLPDPLLQVRD